MNKLIKFSGEFFEAKDDLTKDGYIFLNKLKKMNETSGYIVVGGGNRLRGKDSFYERNASDNMGIISTLLNAFILKEHFKNIGFEAEVFSHFSDFGIKYDPFLAKKEFLNNKWVILATGLGKVGYVSTDLSSVIKALELNVDSLIKVTKVDGIYDKDPKKFNDAVLYENITYNEVLEKKLAIMDLSALAIASENFLPLRICSVDNFDGIIGTNVK